MIILYLKSNNLFLQAIKGFPEVKEENNKLLFPNGIVIINDLTKAGYAPYPDQVLIIPKDEDGNDMPITVDELNLTPMSADALSVSEHIGKLISVNPTLPKPATVRRRFMGENYDVNCFVEQVALEQYQAETLKIGDFVTVSFIEEIPDTEEKLIPIVRGKVYKSW